jgi:hypothetical protein
MDHSTSSGLILRLTIKRSNFPTTTGTGISPSAHRREVRGRGAGNTPAESQLALLSDDDCSRSATMLSSIIHAAAAIMAIHHVSVRT